MSPRRCAISLSGRLLSTHGTVDEPFVTKDVTDYVKRWPQRHYTLATPVTFFASGQDETQVEFSSPSMCAANHERQKRRLGPHQELVELRPEGDDLKIVAIREQRLRE